MKRIISIIMALSVCVGCIPITSYAWMTKNYVSYFSSQSEDVRGDVYLYDDYTTDVIGESPKNYAVNKQGGNAIVNYVDTGDGKGKNCVVITDTHNPGANDYVGPSATRNFDSVGGIVSVEFRFKSEKTNTDIAPFNISIMNGNASACSIIMPSNNGVLCYGYGDGMTLPLAGDIMIPYDEWITTRVILDLKEGKADVEVVADYLKETDIKFSALADYDPKKGRLRYSDLSIRSDFNESEINAVKFATNKWEGKQYIDYLIIEKDASRLNKRDVKGIEPEYITFSADVPSGKYINIMYGNEYCYLTDKAYIENSTTFVSLRDLKKIFDISYSENDMMIICGDKKFSISQEDVKTVNSVLFVPARKILEGLGFSIEWIAETKTIKAAKGDDK